VLTGQAYRGVAARRQAKIMSFDPFNFFTSVGTRAATWLVAAVGVFSLLGARKAFRGNGTWKLFRATLGIFLSLLCVACCLILFGWLVSPHV
jgi:hypothetical protein